MIATIDISALRDGDPDGAVARAIDRACRDNGFFAIVGHGIAPSLADDLQRVSRAFFARPEEQKLAIAMAHAGRRWRGFFPVGGELTSGIPDAKEGIYFGRELPADDPRVIAGVPLHGPNLWPADRLDHRVDAHVDVRHDDRQDAHVNVRLDDRLDDRHDARHDDRVDERTDLPEMRATVLAWIAATSDVAAIVMSAIARALGL
ncbi:MAG: 2-oxoglutarate and iron-dependent oxygenase domain-containing protein, partial [Kofleriaceae bacterium]